MDKTSCAKIDLSCASICVDFNSFASVMLLLNDALLSIACVSSFALYLSLPLLSFFLFLHLSSAGFARFVSFCFDAVNIISLFFCILLRVRHWHRRSTTRTNDVCVSAALMYSTIDDVHARVRESVRTQHEIMRAMLARQLISSFFFVFFSCFFALVFHIKYISMAADAAMIIFGPDSEGQ